MQDLGRGAGSGENRWRNRIGLSLGAWSMFRIIQSKMSKQDFGVGVISSLGMVGEMVPWLLPLLSQKQTLRQGCGYKIVSLRVDSRKSGKEVRGAEEKANKGCIPTDIFTTGTHWLLKPNPTMDSPRVCVEQALEWFHQWSEETKIFTHQFLSLIGGSQFGRHCLLGTSGLSGHVGQGMALQPGNAFWQPVIGWHWHVWELISSGTWEGLR